MKSDKIKLECSWCNVSFYKRRDRIIGDDCCSVECKKEKTESIARCERGKNCIICGTFFIPRTNQLVGDYCSTKCSRPASSLKGNSNQKNIIKRLSTYNANRKNHNLLCGENNPNWKGGSRIINGYKCIHIGGSKYYPEHRMMFENNIGRKLSSNEVVHHKNEKKLDNRLSNFQLMTRAEHASLHHRLRNGKGNSKTKTNVQ